MANRTRIENSEVWTESQVKALLREHGLKVPASTLLRAGEALDEVRLTYPLVVKVSSTDILHKTDVGGVALGVRDRQELAETVEAMRRRFPGRDLLIESMEEKGVEIIIGVLQEPSFGLAIMFGLGGVLAELYKDVTFRLAPLSRADAESMLEDFRGRRLLEGFRGISVSREALVDAILKVSRLAESLGDRLQQMDLNPIFARADDVVVVDAKLLLRSDEPADADAA